MKASMKTREAIVVTLAGLFLGACGGGGDPDPDPIDQHIGAVPDPIPVEDMDKLVPCGTSCPPDEFCVWNKRTYMHGSANYPALADHADVVYPGADLQGKTLYDQIPAPITAPRGGGDIVLASNPNGSLHSKVHLQEISLAAVTGAINEILLAQPQAFPAALELRMERVRAREEIQIELQASASFFDLFEARSGFQLEQSERYSAFAFQLQQNFYGVAFERPSKPHEFYAPSMAAEDLETQVGEGNPAAYVSQVKYGRVFYLLIQATEDSEEMRATLQANFFDIAEGSGRFKHFREFSNLRVSAYAYGGDQEEVLRSIQTLGRWREFWDHLLASNGLLTAKAVAYTARSISTDRVLQNEILADYEVRDCVFPDNCPITLLSPRLGARLDNGCAVDANPIEWTFDWTECPHAEAYHIQIYNRDDLIFENDHASAPRFVYRSSTPFIRMETGWRWRLRVKTFGVWEPWSDSQSFSVESVNTDCETGVVLYTHPNMRGGSQFIDRSVCLEDVRGWDDEVDSLRLKNVRGVRLCEDPERFGLGPCFYFDHDCPDTQEHGFRRNSATELEIDFGF